MIQQSEYEPDPEREEVATAEQLEVFSGLLKRSVEIEFDAVKACFLGLAVGDARGLPFETLVPEQIEAVLDSEKLPFYPLDTNTYLRDTECKPGQVSDDLDLSLAVMKALVEGVRADGSLSMNAVGKYHLEVLERGPIGWGPSTRNAVEAFGTGTPWHQAGQVNAAEGKGLGNGIPMKIAAVGIYAAMVDLEPQKLDEIVRDIALMSHPKSMAVSAGIAHASAIRYCLSATPEDFSREEFINVVVAASKRGEQYLPDTKTSDDITARLEECRNWRTYSDEQIRESFGGGACYVYHSLPFSYMLFLQDPYSFETVERTIRAGGDTDSNAAFVGALVGALHGTEIVPDEMVNSLRGTADLSDTLNAFWRRFSV